MKKYVKASTTEIIKVYEPYEEEYKLLQDVVDLLNAANIPHRTFYVGNTYFDYGQNWKWTTILSDFNLGYENYQNGTTQVLNPKQQRDIIVDRKINEVAQELIDYYTSKSNDSASSSVYTNSTIPKRVKYRFRSPILLTTDENSSSWFEPFYDSYTDYQKEINDAIGDTDLAEYVRDNMTQKISKITMRTSNSKTDDELLDLITTVVASEELTDIELEDLKKYLTGQFSDGWGEGFEQSPIYTYNYEFDDTYEDEETGELIEYTETCTASLFCHVWYIKPSGIQRERWNIQLESVDL